MQKKELKKKTNSDLRNAIYSQPNLVPVILENIREELGAKIDEATANSIDNLFLTGCGDSYFAGVASEFAFRKFAHVDARPVEALNFSRYIAEHAPPKSALIPVSNSGRVSRTIETATKARGKLSTWALTDSPESKLAQAADKVFHPGIPSMPSGGAGTRSYLASLLSLYAFAIHLGELRGVIDSREKDSLNNELDRVGEQIERTLELSEKSVERYVKNFDQDIIFYVGGGPNEATAMYGAAKVMEALSLEGVAVELEEWAHLQFHTTFKNTPYMLIAPPGSSYDRVIEQAVGIKESGGMLTSIVDEEDEQVKSESEYVFRVHGPDMEAFSPLVYCVPLQLLAVDLADARNTSMQMRLDERRKEINFQQIFHSKIQG